MEKIIIKPIGKIKNNFKDGLPKRKKWQDVISKITIKRNLSQCLDGIEEYSHIVVLYWMHRLDETKTVFLKGSLAGRKPERPNPIGLTIVELVKRDGNVLVVKGLDAFDGSPVIDIKPYTGHPRDLVFSFRSPDKF